MKGKQMILVLIIILCCVVFNVFFVTPIESYTSGDVLQHIEGLKRLAKGARIVIENTRTPGGTIATLHTFSTKGPTPIYSVTFKTAREATAAVDQWQAAFWPIMVPVVYRVKHSK